MVKKWKVLVFLIAFAGVIAIAYATGPEQNERSQFKEDLGEWVDACPAGSQLTKIYHYSSDADGSGSTAFIKCTDWKSEQPVIDTTDDYRCDEKKADELFHQRYTSARECELSSGHSYNYCFAIATMKICKERKNEKK